MTRDWTLRWLIDEFPPRLRVRGYGVWLFDERWRLPYRRVDWRRYKDGGGALMILGLAVMVAPLPSALPELPR